MANRCCFSGHSKIYNNNLIDTIKLQAELLIANGITEFWVSNYGDFDKLSAIAIKQLKNIYPYVKLLLVIPYVTKEIDLFKNEYYKTYDEILIAEIPYNTPYKCKIIKSNQFMVDNCDFMICYIKNHFGGAYQTYNYALKHHKIIKNLYKKTSDFSTTRLF